MQGWPTARTCCSCPQHDTVVGLRAQLAEKGLQTYERDGWSEFSTAIVPERREVRPTADRGPILLCCDTSGSMRGARETVAKALALECMRAARAQVMSCLSFRLYISCLQAYSSNCCHALS